MDEEQLERFQGFANDGVPGRVEVPEGGFRVPMERDASREDDPAVAAEELRPPRCLRQWEPEADQVAAVAFHSTNRALSMSRDGGLLCGGFIGRAIVTRDSGGHSGG